MQKNPVVEQNKNIK